MVETKEAKNDNRGNRTDGGSGPPKPTATKVLDLGVSTPGMHKPY